MSVCEIGCGGGDNLNAIYRCCSKKHIHLTLTGIDINADCIAYARKNTVMDNKNFIISDYKDVEFGDHKPDILFASLCCHHFKDEALISMLQWMKANSKTGFFINDLHRHPVAWFFIKIITTLFSRSYLVKNDAPLSVLKGFKKKEWQKLLHAAGITRSAVGRRQSATYSHVTCHANGRHVVPGSPNGRSLESAATSSGNDGAVPWKLCVPIRG